MNLLPLLRRCSAYLYAVLTCIAVALLVLPLRDAIELANIVMLFLLAVFFVAVRLGRGPSVMAAFSAVGLFDFFFVPPHLSFAVSDVQYLLTFFVMLTVGLVTTHLVSGIRAQTALARQAEQEARELYQLARELAGALTVTQVTDIARQFLAKQRRLETAFFFPDAQRELKRASCPGHGPATLELGFARSAFDRGELVELDALAGSGMSALYFPLLTPLCCRGVLAVSPLDQDEEVMRAQRPLLVAVASLIAIAVERLHYVDVAHQAQLDMSAERLRNSILSALSHDLRTPLTSLVGQADALALSKAPLADAERESALAIRDQAQAMGRMLGNLLDMARLQSGRISLRREWQPLDDVLGAVLRLLGPALAAHDVRIQLAPTLPLVAFDAVLMERVLGNLLENAAKYSLPGSVIELMARTDTSHLEVMVCDQGPGFPPSRIPDVFGLFTRGVPDSLKPGVGLGLAICRAIVEAHGGTIVAENRPVGGACVRFTLPLGTPPEIEEEVP